MLMRERDKKLERAVRKLREYARNTRPKNKKINIQFTIKNLG